VAISLYAVTGNASDILGINFDPKRVKVVISTNLPRGEAPIDLENNRVLLGGSIVWPSADGSFTIPDLVGFASADVNPTGIQYKIDLVYVDAASRQEGAWSTGWVSITADATISELVEGQYVPPTYLSGAVAELQALVDEAAAITGLTGEDEAVALLVGDEDSETASALSASIARNAVPRAGGTTTGEQAPRRALDARDYEVKADLRSFPDGVMVSGSNELSCAHYTFSAKDIGKHIKVVGAAAAGAALKTTITGHTSGKAVLASTASTSVTGTYSPTPSIHAPGNFLFGTDDTAAIQALWNAAVTYSTGTADTLASSTRRVEHPRGCSLFFGTLVVPRRSTIHGIGLWGGYGIYDGYGYEQINGTLFYQGWDSNADAIIFTESFSGGGYVISDIADFSVQSDVDNTEGNGIAYRNAAGTPLQWSDGNRAENVAVYGPAENGWHLPGGMVPGKLVNCRGMYCGDYGLDIQMAPNGSMHVIDFFSSDGCGKGAIRVRGGGGFTTQGVLSILNTKYECIENPYRVGAGRGEYAITIDQMGGAVVNIDGLDVIAAGSEDVAPTGAIFLVAGSQTPIIHAKNIYTRVAAGQTGTPVTLHDDNEPTRPIANGVLDFVYTTGGARGNSLWVTTVANLRRVVGSTREWLASAGENPGHQLVGDLPVFSMHNYLPPVDIRQVAWSILADGRMVLRNVKDNGTFRDILSMRPGATRADDRITFDIPVGLSDRQALAGPRMTVGRYYCQPNVASQTSAGPVLDQVYYMPFPIARDCTLDRIGIYITAAAGASGVVRLGLYADDGTGKPGARIVDGGTVVATAATTARSVTINEVVTKGLYHIAVVGQVNVTGLTIPTGQRASQLIGSTDLTTAVQGNARAFVEASVSAGLPSTATPGDPSSASFGNREYIVALRASA
jgi:hypothetical protein